MSDRPLLVLGTTDFAAAVADTAGQAGFRVDGFVENLSRERCAETLAGLPIHWVDDLPRFAGTHEAICGIGTTRRSVFTDRAQGLGMGFATVVHPTAYVSPSTVLGEGSYVGAHAAISSHTTVGRHVQILQGSLIGHHTEIGDFASLMMGANVAGSVRIGEAAYVATGAVVIDHVSVGAHAVIAAGAVVVEDVPGRVQVVGVPARVVKEVEGR